MFVPLMESVHCCGEVMFQVKIISEMCSLEVE
jgi:hypothetical protein